MKSLNCICFWVEGPRGDYFDGLFYNYILLRWQTYESNSQLQKNTNIIDTDTQKFSSPYNADWNILYFFCLQLTNLFLWIQTIVNKPVVLHSPRFACSFSDLLFPRTCAIPLQTLIVNEYALVNHRFSFSNYGLFFVYIHHKITKFDINLFFIYLVMLAKYVSSFQHRKNTVKNYINTFNFREKKPKQR